MENKTVWFDRSSSQAWFPGAQNGWWEEEGEEKKREQHRRKEQKKQKNNEPEMKDQCKG